MNALQRQPDPESLADLISRARSVDGQPPFSDQSLVELERGERVLVWDEDGPAVVGAAVVGTTEFEFVIHPKSRGRGRGSALLARVLVEHPEAKYAWAHGDHPASRALAARFGFEPVRTLLQLLAPVSTRPSREAQGTNGNPLPETVKGALRISPFRPGVDDAAWRALNSKAFAHHPEQGNLTQQDLDDRTNEHWFNADDFLLLADGSGDNNTLIGFCWLKVEGKSGEFYAVGIDPDRQGEGLGRVLMDAGFARLAARGIRTASLYVEADNEPALALYCQYGFTQNTIDVRYRRAIR